MPKFTLSVHYRQTLVDSEVVEVEADTLEEAKEFAEYVCGMEGDEIDADDRAASFPSARMDDERPLRFMDPHEVSDAEIEVVEGDYTEIRVIVPHPVDPDMEDWLSRFDGVPGGMQGGPEQ